MTEMEAMVVVVVVAAEVVMVICLRKYFLQL